METATLTATKWELDTAHSELNFKVKHMMIANLKGGFNSFSVDVDGDDLIRSTISVTIDISSINTNNDQRDTHLKSADFFDVESNREILFKSTSFIRKEDGNFELNGILTMKGVSKEINLDVEFGGINKDPWGNERAGFSVEGKINRKDWGLGWNAALETGGVLVSDEVKISAEIQLIKQ